MRVAHSISRFTLYASRVHWSLLFGGLIVAAIALIALVGPDIAPRDPLEENTIIRIDGEWKIPPFPAFTPGFLLGSDSYGRDLLSRLLWAVRPTMMMVSAVALVRLALGVTVGLGAGWSTGWTGRAMDALIGAALSVPVLMVALGAIAAVGIETGVWAFVVGLCINGWVETARLVREQTRIVKGQLYVEAARALGATDAQVIFRHVLRQIMPMAWMLFAFEISGTLMVTAALGFLGYYIGGDVWVLVDDNAARSISGAPELGQMLATSWVRIDEPWAMIAVGSVVFVAVLGFNLVGRGLRHRLSVKQIARRTWSVRLRENVAARVTRPAGDWVSDRIWKPVTEWQKPRFFYPALMAVVLVAAAGVVAWRWQTVKQTQKASAELPLAEGQLWAAERRDAQGTLWSVSGEPVSPQVQWMFEAGDRLGGGPAVSKQGVVYIVTGAGKLYALDAAGNLYWQARLPAGGVGTPALDKDGRVYVTDKAGHLSAFEPTGELVWRFEPPDEDDFATSGPVVAQDGTAYFIARGHSVQAVSASGEGLWRTRVTQTPTYTAPRLSFDGTRLLVANAMVDAQTGVVQAFESPVQVDRFLTGADGQSYLQSGNEIYQWTLAGMTIETGQRATWDYRQFTVRAAGGPTDVGVTPDGLVWMLYASSREDTRVVWVGRDGSTAGNLHYPQRESRVIAVDQQETTYLCGQGRSGGECLAIHPGSDAPLWQVALTQGGRVNGGALVPGRLYVSTEEGFLYAIGQGAAAPLTVADLPPVRAETPLGPNTETVAWTFEDASGFASAPTVGADGTVFIASNGGTLYALDPTGQVRWQATLPAGPVGPPAQDASGIVYQADKEGNLSAFAPDGALNWRYTPPEPKPSVVGPLVGPDRTIYHTVGTSVVALSPAGDVLWQTRAKTFRTRIPLQLSAEHGLLFWADDAFRLQDGTWLALESPVNADQFVAGRDGQLYLRDKHTVMLWQMNDERVEIVQSAQWDYSRFSNTPPDAAGVTREGVIWVLYTSWRNGSLVWLDGTGRVLGTLNSVLSDSQLVEVLDGDAMAYLCGVGSLGDTRGSYQCGAFVPGTEEPVWLVTLPQDENLPAFGAVTGGALAPGRLYVAMESGVLFAVGEETTAATPGRISAPVAAKTRAAP